MKKMILALAAAAMLTLAGCAETPLQQASQACEGYFAVQQTTKTLKDAGKVTAAQLAPYKESDAAITKACTGAPPATAASAAELASKVGTQVLILEAVNKKGQGK
ncbi:MAG: hypothetical protein B7Z80_12595 [Rhodospirillales bacterium 20-64-7]|nr:MAG: hypothetical protein B7Z80_12595 [Rhodospirillales bacterium 20-64-7]